MISLEVHDRVWMVNDSDPIIAELSEARLQDNVVVVFGRLEVQAAKTFQTEMIKETCSRYPSCRRGQPRKLSLQKEVALRGTNILGSIAAPVTLTAHSSPALLFKNAVDILTLILPSTRSCAAYRRPSCWV